MTARDLFTRDELLGGQLSRRRRAQKAVSTIESRLIYMRAEIQRALQAYLGGDFEQYTRTADRDYLQGLRSRARSEWRPGPCDIERFVSQWRTLVPADPELRAAVLRLAVEHFGLDEENAPGALDALGFHDAAVRAAYRDAFGDAPEAHLSGHASTSRDGATADGDDAAIVEAESTVDWLSLPGGSVLFAPGEPGDALFIVVSGRLRATAPASVGAPRLVAEIGRGEVVGEMEALTGEARTLLVHAARDSELLRIGRETLVGIARQDPAILMRINREMADRMAAQLGGARPARRATATFAIAGVHDGVPLPELAHALAAALASHGETLHVSRQVIEQRLGTANEDDHAEIAAWMSEQEAGHRYVIYEADDHDSEWTRRCLRQADRVLLVAMAGDDPAPGAIEAAIAARPVHPAVELLLVHDPSVHRPSGTAMWTRPRKIDAVYHLRPGAGRQLAHIARRLTGNGVGVALSGGGARGYAHIGVMRALEERNIPVDVIGGTSMGALLGAGFALDRDAADMRRRALQTAGRRHLLDMTLPVAAFFAGRKVSELLKREYEDMRIEDLWQPYFCISTNLTRAEMVVHEEGWLWRAVRASIAIPGIYPPMLAANGDVLVDGGLMNNMPIDLMRARPDVGTVIGVNCSPIQGDTRTYRFGSSVSGWRAVTGRLARRRAPIDAPNLMSTIMRSTEVRSTAVARSDAFKSHADLIIEPDVEMFGRLDFARCDAAIEAGYRAACASLDAWLSTRHGSTSGGQER